ncbi:MAG TPA: helix-turn-helix transcriptional regulator [Bacteroidales bacterium]|nr:helix-turn-helix transcriptional regulator [Bacteroidales bacterium]
MNPDNKTVNDRIAEFIRVKGMRQSEFAKMIGVKDNRLSTIISNNNNPNFEFIQKTMSVYRELNPDWLILGEGTMFRPESGEISTGQSEGESDGGDVRYLKQIIKQQEEMIGALKDHIATLKKEHYCSDGKKSKAG